MSNDTNATNLKNKFNSFIAGGEQAAAVRRTKQIRKRIENLDKIFETGHVDWWQAFKRGPIKFWGEHYFASNGEKDLWDAVQATIHDSLTGRLEEAADRNSALLKEYARAEAKTKELQGLLAVQERVIDMLNKLAHVRKKPKHLRASFVDIC